MQTRKRKLRTSGLGKTHKPVSITSRPLFNVGDFQKKFTTAFAAERDILSMFPIDEIFFEPLDIDCKDAFMPGSFEVIQESINSQIEKSAELRRTGNGNWSEIDLKVMPSYNEIQAKFQGKLVSLTDESKKETGLMLPRKEVNYVTPQMQKNELSDEFKEIPENEVVLNVSFYHSERNLKTQEYLVLGSQKLHLLRDKLYCLGDHTTNTGDYKSGYFFFENTFYNDMREKDNIDYSTNVIEWAGQNDLYRQTGAWPLFAQKMEETTFYDLNLRVGEKYLYCHHGNCKHYIIFNEVRLLNDQDNQNYNSYPLQTYQSKIRRRKCMVCEIHPAKWVAFKDRYSAENPTFYCDSCYRQFHYDENGKLLYDDFQVYRYFHE